jgi:hemerythrin-like domain-containing protein
MPSMRKSKETSATNTAEGSALALLEQDHREAKGFFDDYEKLDNAEQKEALAVKICIALRVHTEIEEEIFYPAAREKLQSPELIDEAIVEHAAAKQLIDEIEAMEGGDPLLDAKVKVLGEQIRHHVEEEESELFPKLRDGKLDEEGLAEKMAALKQRLLTELAEHGDAL